MPAFPLSRVLDMVKSSRRPEFRPQQRLSANLTARLVFLVAVPAAYFVIASAGRQAAYISNQKAPAGKASLLIMFNFALEYVIPLGKRPVGRPRMRPERNT